MTDKIRTVSAADLPVLYQICAIETNDLEDDFLLGHVFVGPYAALEPDVSFVATRDGRPVGYCVATRNAQKFYERCEKEWFPTLREQYGQREEGDESFAGFLHWMIHHGHRPEEGLEAYPAHLHISLLPEVRKQGLGRKLIQALIDRLQELGVPGLYLEVATANENAIAFYEHLGFHRVEEFSTAIIFGMKWE